MRIRCGCYLLAGVLALLAPAAQALRIDGLNPLEPQLAVDVMPTVTAHRMEIRLRDRLLSVAPWPSFLPQRFGRQKIEASRRLLPAGPSDRLSFTRPAERRPWLIVGQGARDGTVLAGAWRLQRAGDGWAIAEGGNVQAWHAAAPLSVPVDGARWCLYLLDADQPTLQKGVAAEREPQAAWAAQRLDANRACAPMR